MQVTPKEIRQARAFLQMRGIPSRLIRPFEFAATAQRLGKNFAEALDLIIALTKTTQGRGPAPRAERAITGKETVL